MLSIIIPIFNDLQVTKNCVKSIFEWTKDFELIIVDNNSSENGFKEYYEEIKNKVKIIKLDKNYGFGIACNKGTKESIGEYICILNKYIISMSRSYWNIILYWILPQMVATNACWCRPF